MAKHTLGVRLRVLSYGHPKEGYIERDPPYREAFPGLEVPGFLGTLFAAGVNGAEIEAPDIEVDEEGQPTSTEATIEQYQSDVEEQIGSLFTKHVTDGPSDVPDSHWTLLSPPFWTNSGGSRWLFGLGALAFEVGVQRVNPRTGATVGAPESYRKKYDCGMVAKYWLCFHIV